MLISQNIFILLTLRAYVIERPTIPGDSVSRAITANRAAKNRIQLPTNSSLTANHLQYTYNSNVRCDFNNPSVQPMVN